MFGNSPPPAGSTASNPTFSILGIWRLGEQLNEPARPQADHQLFLAQPADAEGSPRWDYILKTVSSDLAAEETGALRARRLEAARQLSATVSAAEVNHPNLIAVLDASLSGQQPFVVMPRLSGQTLQQRCQTMPELAVPVALWWTRQIAQAVAALHAKGWVHGDVKPANVLIDDRGHVTLLDLGFAARVHTPMHRLFRGTPQYAPPELLQGNTAALPAMDVFSIGRVLWQLLTQTSGYDPLALEPIAELIESMVAEEVDQRPTAAQLVQRLLVLEIETLGGHIIPANANRRVA